MVCPECKAEYRDGFTRCTDCNRSLVGSLAEQREPEEMVPLLTTTDPGFLAIARSVLVAAGLDHVVHGEAGVSLFPLGAAGGRVTRRVTGAVILVGRQRLEEARALLDGAAEEP